MSVVDPSSAVTAKARAKYGVRIRKKDYDAMIKCESVEEVVQYLKTYTHFHGVLEKVSKDIHRGNLEEILRESAFEDFLSLCRYISGESPVASYILRSRETRELMRFVTLLSIGRPHEYLFTLPLYFNKHTAIDLSALSKGVDDHEDLLAILEGTPYRAILRDHPPDMNGNYDLPLIENELENFILQRLYEDIGKIKNKKDRAQLTELFDTLSDYHNYSRIKRLKRYYHMSSEAIRSYLLRYGHVTGRKLDRILAKETQDEVDAALAQTSVGKKAERMGDNSEMAIHGRYAMCRHQLYFSSNPEIVLLAYHILSENELSDVVAIIEGVRYRMEPESIREALISGGE